MKYHVLCNVFQLDDFLRDSYHLLQVVAVALEQVAWDHQDGSSFYPNFSKVQYDLKMVSFRVIYRRSCIVLMCGIWAWGSSDWSFTCRGIRQVKGKSQIKPNTCQRAVLMFGQFRGNKLYDESYYPYFVVETLHRYLPWGKFTQNS